MSDVLSLGALHNADPVPGHIQQTFEQLPVKAIAIDSRKVEAGAVFFAIPGERVDGHDFIGQARERGACAAVVERPIADSLPQIQVSNSVRALGGIAQRLRKRYSGKLIAITGSSGKTSVKRFTRQILANHGKVTATPGNYNNEIGVPLTLAALQEETEFAVVEMGAAQRGDIAYLVNIAKPDIVLVNNVGHAHVGRFGSLEKTAQAKGEIYDGIGSSSIAVVNADDRFADEFIQRISKNKSTPSIIRYSLEGHATDIYASDIALGKDGCATCRLCVSAKLLQQEHDFCCESISPTPGMHNVSNLLAAVSLAIAAGMPVDELELAIKNLAVTGEDAANSAKESGRLDYVRNDAAIQLIDDTYNANPESTQAAIDHLAFAARQQSRSAILILGAMAELGEASAEHHFAIGGYACRAGIDVLLASGEFAEDYVRGFEEARGESGSMQGALQALAFGNKTELSREFCKRFTAYFPMTVLVKGSRAAAMETVVANLMNELLQQELPC